MEDAMEDKIILGISACLLGEKVRYDGQHKYDAWLVETLGGYVDYIPVCAEVECGLGVPREAMRLVGDADAPRMVTGRTNIDHTERMLDFCGPRLKELAVRDLCGFIFKSKSPSCGMERVKVYPPSAGAAARTGKGIFASEFMRDFPLLPVEEEGRLHDPILRENFIERIFVMRRWRELCGKPFSAGSLVDFHTRHKLLLMAHSPELYREMGKLVAAVTQYKPQDFASLYLEKLMLATSRPATPARHKNVMQHILGYFKRDITAAEKQELLDLIDDYRDGMIPLIVPITMINHYVRKYAKEYLAGQFYLHPHPAELALRNHV
jgi:uncharacterized protein YbgA (DUF1722 family)/uncharacterized protein YbbK (DUF523 family)